MVLGCGLSFVRRPELRAGARELADALRAEEAEHPDAHLEGPAPEVSAVVPALLAGAARRGRRVKHCRRCPRCEDVGRAPEARSSWADHNNGNNNNNKHNN